MRQDACSCAPTTQTTLPATVTAFSPASSSKAATSCALITQPIMPCASTRLTTSLTTDATRSTVATLSGPRISRACASTLAQILGNVATTVSRLNCSFCLATGICPASRLRFASPTIRLLRVSLPKRHSAASRISTGMFIVRCKAASCSSVFIAQSSGSPWQAPRDENGRLAANAVPHRSHVNLVFEGSFLPFPPAYAALSNPRRQPEAARAGIGPRVGTIGQDVVLHPLAGLFPARCTRIAWVKANRLHLRAPLPVVITARGMLAVNVLPNVRHLVHHDRTIHSSLLPKKWSGLSESSWYLVPSARVIKRTGEKWPAE